MNVRVRTKDLVLTRVIDAPIEDVWKAWTDCEQVKRWWGPKGFTSHTCTIDLRVGGTYLFHMRAPEDQGGQNYYLTGVYKRIVPLELLEFGQSLADADGNVIDPMETGLPADIPKEMRTTVTFRRVGDRTELTVTEHNWEVGEQRDLSEAGMNESLDKLEEALATR
ncbi:MAG TPA: SRPBCC domain-containing protein [Chloroflexi bacterium]|jgi:uncharacterized protein YndB with AHSA1/START domain|nr:SRPBCC domain-containing protein [Chloroflexota bacterium]